MKNKINPPVFYQFIKTKDYIINDKFYFESVKYNDKICEIEKPYKLLSFIKLV